MSAPRDLHDFAARYTAAWANHDAPGVAAFHSPGSSLSVNGGTPAVGRGAIEEVVRGFLTAFPDLDLRMDGVDQDGHRVRYRWTLLGTNSGPGGTGNRVRISGFEEWQMAPDGLIARSEGHFDSQEYQCQLEHGVDR